MSGHLERLSDSYKMTLLVPYYRDTEWGPEWTCKGAGLDFCSLEGMCNYPDSCALDPSGEFGGMSVTPHTPKTVADMNNGDIVEAAWLYKSVSPPLSPPPPHAPRRINQTYSVTVTASQLWQPGRVTIPREYFYDREREQDRKTHTERSYQDVFLLGIRCPDSGSCATLARE